MSAEVSVFNASGESKGKQALPSIFSETSEKASTYLLHEVVVGLQRNKRRGTSNTKTRAEVSGGGRKPWKQKGTGNARSGSNRSPLWRKGGIIFGPRPRSYWSALPQAKKAWATVLALRSKVQEQKISLVETPTKVLKTQDAQKLLTKILPTGRVLWVFDKKEAELVRAMRNIPRFQWTLAQGVNARDITLSEYVLMSPSALEGLGKQLEGSLS